MPFQFQNLDEVTRKFMVEEIEAAIRDGNLYYSKHFYPAGNVAWPNLLLDAARNYNEHWLAYQIETQGLMKGLGGSRTPSGGYTIKHVPNIAAETLAEGQFNRYYILGVCRRALAEGKAEVFIYRAKAVHKPRPESEMLIGRSRDPNNVIAELQPCSSSLSSDLVRPNSGISVHL